MAPIFGAHGGHKKCRLDANSGALARTIKPSNSLIYPRQMGSPLFAVDRDYATENHGVGGSIPPLGTILLTPCEYYEFPLPAHHRRAASNRRKIVLRRIGGG